LNWLEVEGARYKVQGSRCKGEEGSEQEQTAEGQPETVGFYRYPDMSCRGRHGGLLARNLLAISAHTFASEIRNPRDDHGEIIVKLDRHGMIPKEFAGGTQEMAGL
jgi:hypothetical protein